MISRIKGHGGRYCEGRGTCTKLATWIEIRQEGNHRIEKAYCADCKPAEPIAPAPSVDEYGEENNEKSD